jgi:hypothetical protein
LKLKIIEEGYVLNLKSDRRMARKKNIHFMPTELPNEYGSPFEK